MPGKIASNLRAPPRRAEREVVTSTAGESGPCSACESRSTATTSGSASSSAITRISVGPANRSMPTSPNSCRLASATSPLPGPAQQVDPADAPGSEGQPAISPDAAEQVDLAAWLRCAAAMVAAGAPRANRRRAGCPTLLTPWDLGPRHGHVGGGGERVAAAGDAGAGGGDSAGARWPRKTPGSVSTPRSRAWTRAAPARTPAPAPWTNWMSSMTCHGEGRDDVLDPPGGEQASSRGDQLSNLAEYARTASSRPRSRMSAMTPVTVSSCLPRHLRRRDCLLLGR